MERDSTTLGVVRAVVVAVSTAVAASVAATAAADCPKRADELSLFAADVNSDGQLDFLVRAKPTFVPLPLDDDMVFVIPVPKPINGFVLTSSGSRYTTTTLPPQASIPQGWSPSAGTLLVGDVQGTGCPAVLLQAATGAKSFLVGYDGAQNPYIIQQLGFLPGETGDFSDAALVFKDTNGDARMDLEASRSGAVQAIYLADAGGVLRLDPSASALAVWRSFLTAMAANDVDRSLRHLTSSGLWIYEGPMRAMAAELSLLPARTVDFGVIDANAQAVRLAIIVDPPPATTGPGFIHYAALLNDKGNWQIESF